MGRVLCVACRLRVGGLSAQTNPTSKQPKPKTQPTLLTQHPNHTKRLSVQCCMWCVFRVACLLRAVGLPCENQPTNNPTNATTQPTSRNTHTIHNACRCIDVCGVCCVMHVASRLLGCRAKPHEQTTQGNNATNTTQHPNHTKRLSVRCWMRCAWRVACRPRVVVLPGETPQATNPSQQNNQHYTTPKPYEPPVDSVLYVM
jgi:hypothetical protein